jgi:hypothetical protein
MNWGFLAGAFAKPKSCRQQDYLQSTAVSSATPKYADVFYAEQPFG